MIFLYKIYGSATNVMLKLALHFGNARQVPELQPYIYRTTKFIIQKKEKKRYKTLLIKLIQVKNN